MRLIMFMLVGVVVLGGAQVYMGHHLAKRLGLGERARRGMWIMLGAMTLLPLVNFVASRVMSAGTVAPLTWVGMMSLGLSSVLFILIVTVDVVGWVMGRGSRAIRRLLSSEDTSKPADPSRRGFFGKVATLGAVGTTGGVGGVGLQQATQTAEIVRVEVPIVDLPEALEGYRIVQLSDVHVGPTIRRKQLQAIVDRANSLDADLVAVTGDLIDGYVEDLRDEVAPLAELSGKDGVFFVTGNHEYYWDGPAWCEEVRRLGLTVLNNEHRVVVRGGARLLVAGCTDYKAGDLLDSHASSPAKARAAAPSCDVDLLLAHQPRSIYAAADAGYDLQLSGHTHGGQYFPMNLLVHLAQPYVAGLAQHGPTAIYVSRGTGYWGPPMRVGAPHEITLLELRRA